MAVASSSFLSQPFTDHACDASRAFGPASSKSPSFRIMRHRGSFVESRLRCQGTLALGFDTGSSRFFHLAHRFAAFRSAASWFSWRNRVG